MSDNYENSDDENAEITKDLVIYEIRNFVVEEYIKCFEGESDEDPQKKVSVSEFLKAQEMICKLSGFFDSSGSGQDLPSEARLKIP